MAKIWYSIYRHLTYTYIHTYIHKYIPTYYKVVNISKESVEVKWKVEFKYILYAWFLYPWQWYGFPVCCIAYFLAKISYYLYLACRENANFHKKIYA